jgi:hypothetical protein
MRQLKMVTIGALAMLMLGSLASASAVARATPEFNPAVKQAGRSGESRLQAPGIVGGNPIVCASDTAKTTPTGRTGGEFERLYEKCLVKFLLLFLCTGLSATAGSSSIKSTGVYNLRYLNPAHTRAAYKWTFSPVHFTCKNGGTEILIELRGGVVSTIGPVNKKVSSSEDFTATEKETEGKDEFTKAENEAGTEEETVELEMSESGKAFKQAGEETTEELAPEKETEIIS